MTTRFHRIALYGWPGLGAEQPKYLTVATTTAAIATAQGATFRDSGERERDGTPIWRPAPPRATYAR